VHQNLLLRADLGQDARIESLAGLADDFREGGFARRAIAAYEEVLAHDSGHVAALRGLLGLLLGLGESERALSIHRRLARLEAPADPDAEVALLTRIAQALHEKGDTNGARKSLRRALRKNARFAPARMLLGELEAERGKNKAALAAWRQVALQGGAGAAGVYPRLASAFATQGKSEKYEGFLRDRVAERPDDCELRIALVRALAQRGAVDSAISEIRLLLETNPWDLNARIVLGELLLANGREGEAAKAYGELLEVLEKHRDLTPQERLE
jgi:lipopolysaccharide biosynthesis regulator YciM